MEEGPIEAGDFVRWKDGSGLVKYINDSLAQVVTASGRSGIRHLDYLTLVAKGR